MAKPQVPQETNIQFRGVPWSRQGAVRSSSYLGPLGRFTLWACWALMGPPWALVRRALVGWALVDEGLVGHTLIGPVGNLWARPLWDPWALMGSGHGD